MCYWTFISEGVVPKAWKQAIITPVGLPKTALVSGVSDLRPIIRYVKSSILSRIVERLVVSNYLIPYIPRENLVDQYAHINSTTCAVPGYIAN